MSGLVGYVDAGYDELVREFGQPDLEADGYKVDAEWTIMTPAGEARIYNYKDGIHYNGPSGTPVEEIRNWHIGGDAKAVVGYIHERLSKKTKVWQATWICPFNDADDSDGINPLFSTRKKAVEFLEKTARQDWHAEVDGVFPGMKWDEQFEWRREGTINHENLEGNRYIAREVEVQ